MRIYIHCLLAILSNVMVSSQLIRCMITRPLKTSIHLEYQSVRKRYPRIRNPQVHPAKKDVTNNFQNLMARICMNNLRYPTMEMWCGSAQESAKPGQACVVCSSMEDNQFFAWSTTCREQCQHLAQIYRIFEIADQWIHLGWDLNRQGNGTVYIAPSL